MNYFLSGLFFFFVGLFGIMPFFVLYLFSDFAKIVLGRIIKYRRKVIYTNLKNAFPNKDEKELDRLVKLTYQNLTDNLAESLKTFTMSKRSIVKRHKILNPELLDKYYEKGQSIIGVAAHYNNWEWGSLSAGLQSKYGFIALYKPLSNPIIDKALRKSRSKCGTILASIYNTSKIFEENKGQPKVYLMAADQSPSHPQLKHALWYNFLGRETAFLHGLEKHAKANNYPVVYIDIQRKKRGYYSVELSELSDKPGVLRDGELTERYVRKLESVIIQQPENWLWSHKRWKHTPVK